MNTQQISAVKQSWRLVVPHAEAVGEQFYANLFVIDPALRHLFPASMAHQPQRLMAALTLLIDHLDNADVVTRELTGLAQRHVRYGVQPAHYASVGKALIQTLHDGLGDHWTPDVRTAWGALYQTVADAMITFAEQPAPTRT